MVHCSGLKGDLALTAKGLSNDAVTIGDIDSRIALDGRHRLYRQSCSLTTKAPSCGQAATSRSLRPGTLEPLEDPLVNLTADAGHT